MSNTFKDKPSQVRRRGLNHENQWEFHDVIKYEAESACWLTGELRSYTRYLHLPKAGVRRKLPKHTDTEYHWMNTPSWWIHDYHTVPQRAQNRNAEHTVKGLQPEQLVDFDWPLGGRKPHVYYW